MEPRFREHGNAARTARAMHPGHRIIGDDLQPGVYPYGGALRAAARNATVLSLPGCAPSRREDARASCPLVSATPPE